MGLNKLENDEKYVKKTAERAIVHKCYAATLGYYKDDYIKYFADPEKQYTTVTICYTLRVLGCRMFIDKFLSLFPNEKVQFVNLGAGLDTISFWLLNKFSNVICYETDFETQLRLKSNIMINNECFKELLPDMYLVDGFIKSNRYKMVPFDLTKVDEFDRLLDSGLSRDLPTIFLAEAVFMYIDPDYTDPVLKLLSGFCNKSSCFICWEFSSSIPNEKFFNFTIEKFKEYNVELKGLKKYKNAKEHVERHKRLGWDDSIYTFLATTWNLLSEEERDRIKSIEKFNEMEELATLSTFYMGCIATKNLENPKEFNKYFEKMNKNYKESQNLEENQNQKLLIPPENFNREYFENLMDVAFSGIKED